MEIVINGEKIYTEADFHDAISKALKLSACYGNNLDALWDVLSTDVERPIRLIWKRSDSSSAQLGDLFGGIVEVLKGVETQDVEWRLAEKFELRLE